MEELFLKFWLYSFSHTVWHLGAVSVFSGMVVYYSLDCVDGGILSWGCFVVLGELILLLFVRKGVVWWRRRSPSPKITTKQPPQHHKTTPTKNATINITLLKNFRSSELKIQLGITITNQFAIWRVETFPIVEWSVIHIIAWTTD